MGQPYARTHCIEGITGKYSKPTSPFWYRQYLWNSHKPDIPLSMSSDHRPYSSPPFRSTVRIHRGIYKEECGG